MALRCSDLPCLQRRPKFRQDPNAVFRLSTDIESISGKVLEGGIDVGVVVDNISSDSRRTSERIQRPINH